MSKIIITTKESLEKFKQLKREDQLERNREHYNTTNIYRIAAIEKLGRKLVRGEHVHHIDMDSNNNAPENLYVYDSSTKHGKAHGSFNKLVAGLVRDNIIGFKDGKYFRF